MKKLFLISLLMLVCASGYCDDYEEGSKDGEPTDEIPVIGTPKKKPYKRKIMHTVDGTMLSICFQCSYTDVRIVLLGSAGEVTIGSFPTISSGQQFHHILSDGVTSIMVFSGNTVVYCSIL